MTAYTPDLAKVATTTIRRGCGTAPDALCIMQAIDYVTSGGTSDHPECVSPIITSFLIPWNDALPSDADRDRLLRPLIADVIGTRATDADELTRSWLAYDWLVRVQMVAWMRLTPSLVPHAEAVAALEPITSKATLDAAWPAISAAREASRAAMDAAWDAAWAAAWAALAETVAGAAAWAALAETVAWAAAWAAARDAAWDAAGDAAGVAAGAAAWAALAETVAWAAAWAALAETVASLQLSAQDLVRRMCQVGR